MRTLRASFSLMTMYLLLLLTSLALHPRIASAQSDTQSGNCEYWNLRETPETFQASIAPKEIQQCLREKKFIKDHHIVFEDYVEAWKDVAKDKKDYTIPLLIQGGTLQARTSDNPETNGGGIRLWEFQDPTVTKASVIPEEHCKTLGIDNKDEPVFLIRAKIVWNGVILDSRIMKSIDRVQFSKEVDFYRAKFRKKTNFNETQFSKKSNFREAQFSKEADFSAAQFCNKSNFIETQFSKEVYFIETQFHSVALFKEAQFSKRTNFSRAEFSDGANFSDTQFHNAVFFMETQFSKRTDFSGAEFSDGVEFSHESIFSQATFGDATDFSEAQFSNKVSFSEAEFSKEADFFRAQFRQEADFSEAQFSKEANFSKAELDATHLTGSINNIILQDANLTRAQYEISSSPSRGFVGGIKGLSTVWFEPEKQTGLVLLRAALKDAGLRKLEREATYALKRTQRYHAWPVFCPPGASEWCETYNRSSDEKTMTWFDGMFNYFLFEITSNYGMTPERPLVILLFLIPCFSLFYMPALRTHGQAGIWVTRPADRIRHNEEEGKPSRITREFFFPRLQERSSEKWWGRPLRWVCVPLIAVYFSLLSSFSIGWRELNVGNWITRIQPREYTLQADGWVRVVSGIQSLISVYLLAMWALTYFGRPFE